METEKIAPQQGKHLGIKQNTQSIENSPVTQYQM